MQGSGASGSSIVRFWNLPWNCHARSTKHSEHYRKVAGVLLERQYKASGISGGRWCRVFEPTGSAGK